MREVVERSHSRAITCARCSSNPMMYLCVGCDVPLCEPCYIAHECPGTEIGGDVWTDHDRLADADESP